MIILRNKQFSNQGELNKLGKETDKDIRKAVEGTKAEEKVDKILDKSAEEMKETAKKEPTSEELFNKWKKSGDDKDAYEFMNAWVKDTYVPARKEGKFVDTSREAQEAANRYYKNNIEQKNYSKQDREVVPDDIAEKAKKDGVIQKDKNGDWRIISLKTKTNKSGKAEYWPQKSKNREDMVKILQSYQVNKHK